MRNINELIEGIPFLHVALWDKENLSKGARACPRVEKINGLAPSQASVCSSLKGKGAGS